MAERRGNDTAQCGYGLLGLCCDSCLAGPCRLSPFAGDDAGACGAGRDWIVANNLRERVLLESLQTMAAVREKIDQASRQRQAAPHRKAIELLLDPGARAGTGLADLFSPSGAFPTLHTLGMVQGTWMAALLAAAAGRPDAQQDPEAILAEALRLAALSLVARELAGNPAGADMTLPEAPSPLLVIIADETGGPDPAREELLKGIAAACAGAARTYRLPPAALPAFSRRVFGAWGVPLAFTGSIAVVASAAAIPGLGALSLGFSLLPLPAYPLRGSARVEGYLTGRMKETFGHGCLSVPHGEEIGAALLRSLRP